MSPICIVVSESPQKAGQYGERIEQGKRESSRRSA
jgi:hypothetical protein